MESGRFHARAIPETVRWGDAGTGTLQLGLSVECKGKEGPFTGVTYLSFTDKALAMSIDRLRAMGVEVQHETLQRDMEALKGLGSKEFEVDCKQETGPDGKARWKVDIVTGPTIAVFDKPVEPKIAAARIAAMAGKPVAAPAGTKPPPF